MSRRLPTLYNELLGAMENQKKALGEARLDDVMAIQQERRRIIADIREEEGNGSAGTSGVGASPETDRTLEQILSLDVELQASVGRQMKDTLDKLGTIRDIKNTLALQAGRRRTGGRVNVNV